MIADWPALRALALSLNLPQVTMDHPHGHEALKAHGKPWCNWSPYVDAAVFHADFDEREMLLASDPQTFCLHPHYVKYRYVLARAGRIDPAWAAGRLLARWRDLAPKRWLAEWDAGSV